MILSLSQIICVNVEPSGFVHNTHLKMCTVATGRKFDFIRLVSKKIL